MNLKNTILMTAALAFISSAAIGEQADTPYDGSWEALQEMPVPAWFDDGKIGIFIHWGPYSAIGYRRGNRGYAEHVPKLLYSDPKHYHPYMQERWGATPPEFGYKDIIPEFKAENWDPDAWATLFKEVGAHYVVMTAEHHDGWANWDSDLTPWNAADMGPKRDLVGDLGKALKKQGLKYAPSYHRERHQTFFAKKLYVVDAKPQDAIAEEIKRVPEAASLYGPFGTTKEFVDDYVARWQEIQAKYQPDFLWMDDFPIYTRDGNNVRKGVAKPEVQYFDDQLRLMITDFMNDGAARGAEVYMNNKGGNRNWPDGVGCLEKDNLKLNVIGPKWQSCTTFGTSFGYLEGDTYKTVESVIHEMIEVISRNGNFLINIGPKADGTIPEPQVERLQAMGDWLRINGEAIYGSRYWKVSDQKDEHLAFTSNGKALYAIKMAEPVAPFTIKATAGWSDGQVKSVRLLGSEAKVNWELTAKGLLISPPADLGPSKNAWTFEIMTDREQHVPNVIQRDADKALKGTKKVDLDGHDKVRTKPRKAPKAELKAPVSKLPKSSVESLSKPNVIFIFADDMGYGEVQALNPKRGLIKTPYLDSMVADGMTFTDAHTTSSVCTPSRYGLLTGRYNWRTKLQSGVTTGGKPCLIAPDRMTLGTLFQEQGYSTAIFGKWHLDYEYEIPAALKGVQASKKTKTHYLPGKPIGTKIIGGPVARGFDTFFGYHHGRSMSAIVEDDTITDEVHIVDILPLLTRKLVEHIDDKADEAKSGKPFFIYYPMSSPHSPVVPAPEWKGKSGLNAHGDFVMQTDASVGDILDALERNGLSENTIVIFSADNGTSAKASNMAELLKMEHYSSADLRGSKTDLWEGGHRVPFLLRWPAQVKANTQMNQIVSMSDMMATFAEMFGVQFDDDTAEDSISFLPALYGKPIASPRTSVVHHSSFGRFSIREGDWKLLLAPGSGGLTLTDVKAASEGLPDMQLYNVKKDLGETTNLVDQYPEKVKSLIALLESKVANGRSTPGSVQKNDIEKIDIWKKVTVKRK